MGFIVVSGIAEQQAELEKDMGIGLVAHKESARRFGIPCIYCSSIRVVGESYWYFFRRASTA